MPACPLLGQPSMQGGSRIFLPFEHLPDGLHGDDSGQSYEEKLL